MLTMVLDDDDESGQIHQLKRYITLGGDADDGGSYACVEAEIYGIYGNSFFFFFFFFLEKE